jgi:hypothetical protein
MSPNEVSCLGLAVWIRQGEKHQQSCTGDLFEHVRCRSDRIQVELTIEVWVGQPFGLDRAWERVSMDGVVVIMRCLVCRECNMALLAVLSPQLRQCSFASSQMVCLVTM